MMENDKFKVLPSSRIEDTDYSGSSLHSRHCLNGYTIKEMIDKHIFPGIYTGCMEDKCIYSVKIIHVGNSTNSSSSSLVNKTAVRQATDRFSREGHFTKYLWEKFGIGPKYYGHWLCKDVGIIVTEKWDRSLDEGECITVGMFTKLISQVSTLHKDGLIHGEILPHNIFIKHKGDGYDITIGDFSQIRPPSMWSSEHLSNLTNQHYLKSIESRDFWNNTKGVNEYFRKYKELPRDLINSVVSQPKMLDSDMLYWYNKSDCCTMTTVFDIRLNDLSKVPESKSKTRRLKRALRDMKSYFKLRRST